ncbi:MAG: hypothetical protein J6X89_06420 [Bacteroidales bacterium]|nr:hypothetical protein [Bacteroidales bacterium]
MDVIIFTSSLHDTSLLDKKRTDALQRHFCGRELHFINYHDGLEVAADAVCFIATGGTEELFSRIWEKLPQPVMLLSDGYHNSFAAAREIASFLQQRGVRHTLVNLPLEDGAPCPAGDDAPAAGSAPALDPYADKRVIKALASARIGLIGGASAWLISSGIDREAVCSDFGCEFIDIPISEVEEEYRNTAACDTAEAAATYSREALSDAERMYRALKAICNRYRLTALTIKCFDLLGTCHTTSCLALACLSDEGIISGCEGDVPSLWTLLVARTLSGRPAFMANPSSSCEAECTVDFAHCTIPFSMCESYSLPSHFESGIGIGVAGILSPGPCKLLKIGGTQLREVYTAEGEIVCNTHIAARCRTQVRFRFPSRAEYVRFMDSRLGNHIILYR